MTAGPFGFASASALSKPVAPKWYSPWRILGTIVLMAAIGVVMAVLLQRAGAKEPVLALSQRVPESAILTREDLTTVSAAGNLSAIPVENIDEVVGRRVTYTLEAGALLQSQALVPADQMDTAQANVGIAVPASQAPDGLQVGDRVRVLQVPDSTSSEVADDPAFASSPQVLADGALVMSVGEDPQSSGGLMLTLRVATDATGSLVVASRRDQIGLVQVSGT